MARKKLQKMAALKAFSNVFEEDDRLSENWYRAYFDNDHPLTLELACGWGEYTLGLAEKFPRKNFIGIDIKGARLWRAAKQATAAGLNNAVFLRARIEALQTYFCESCVDEIWITFPDPFPKKSRARKRLTAPDYLRIYKSVLKTDGVVHLKTDDSNLYEYTLTVLGELDCTILEKTEAIDYSEENPLTTILTRYERKFLQQEIPIKYVAFQP